MRELPSFRRRERFRQRFGRARPDAKHREKRRHPLPNRRPRSLWFQPSLALPSQPSHIRQEIADKPLRRCKLVWLLSVAIMAVVAFAGFVVVEDKPCSGQSIE